MVILQFNVCQSSDCSTLTFKETTGIFNDPDNVGGWGGDNEATTDAISATLTATLADGSIHIIDLYDTFPTSDNTFEYTIVNEDIGYITGSPIDDQLITWVYTVTTSTEAIYTQTIVTAFYCQAKCCVNTMLANIDMTCTSCSKKQKADFIEAYIQLKGLIYNANAGNTVEYTNILAQLNKLCTNSNCHGCR